MSGFVRKYSQDFKKDVRGLSRARCWRVRELENIIERSVALATARSSGSTTCRSTWP